MKRLMLVLPLLLLLFPACVLAAPAAKSVTYASLLSGKVVPLTVKFQSLDQNWRSFSVSGVQPQGATMLAAVYGAGGSTSYYTRGRTVSVQGETYLVAYSAASKGPDMAAFIASRGRTAPASEVPTADTMLELSLLHLRTMGSLTNIRPFNLQAELAAAARAAESLAQMMQAGASFESDDDTNARLKNLALAINMYATDMDVLPTLADPAAARAELEDYVRNDEVFTDPQSGEPFALNAALSGAAGESVADSAKTVVAYQVAADSNGNRQVAFLNGRTATVDAREWAELMAPQARVSGRLKQLAAALDMCSGDNGGVLPNLADPEATRTALDQYIGAEDVLQDEDTGEYFALNASLAGRSVPSIKDPAHVVVAYQATPDNEGRRGVIFADWHVSSVDEAEWAKLTASSGIQ